MMRALKTASDSADGHKKQPGSPDDVSGGNAKVAGPFWAAQE